MNTTTRLSESLLLSIRSWPAEDPTSQSLPSKISRINAQKGSFRNITEESLEEEIRAVEAGGTQSEDCNTTDQAHDTKSRREELIAARDEVIKQVGWVNRQAQMEALFALDFVSLLLSKETPRQAELSMSPILKQNAPMGSLGVDKTHAPPKPSEAESRDRDLISRGWKLEALSSAADSLLQSATKLEREMEQEAKYWEQVLNIRDKGWSVCRLPRERQTLGVRYGFAEATAEFKDRGLAALRRAEDGSITLDQGLSSAQPKAVQVRIQKDRSIIGASTLPYISTDTEPSIEDLILRARNTIFEEELFHEVTREARVLANQGVYNPGSTIQLPFSEDRQILIDLVPLDEGPFQVEGTTSDSLADAIALSLRILLSYAHRQTLHRRSQIPPPITERKRPTPIHAILRPILSHMQHATALSSLAAFYSTLTPPLHSASLPFTISTTPTSGLNKLTPITPTTLKDSPPTVETLVDTLSRPLESTTTINLPSSTALTLKTRTHLGTTYELLSPPSLLPSANVPPSMHFTSFNELRSYFTYLLTLSLVSLIASYTPHLPSSSDEASSSQAATPAVTGEAAWIPSLQVGEMTKGYSKMSRTKLLIVEVLSAGKISLRWGWMNGKGERSVYTWDGEEGLNGEQKKGFEQVVREASIYA